MRHKLFFIIAAFAACIVLSCTDKSDNIIEKGEMEDILYDLHLADGMAMQAKDGYNNNVVKYRTAVLKKYKVSQDLFDKSMVYYMRHTDELHDMYQDIADRMQDEANKLGADGMASFSVAGDSTNVWNGEKSFVLMPNQPYNVYDFKLKVDTAFHKGDRLILSFKTDFIFQDGIRDGVVMLAMRLGNDSVASRVIHVSSSMPSTLEIDDNDSLGIKDVRGFFTLTKNNDMNASSTTLQLMSVHDIMLIRVHPAKQKGGNVPVTPSDGRIPVNTSGPDSDRMKPVLTR